MKPEIADDIESLIQFTDYAVPKLLEIEKLSPNLIIETAKATRRLETWLATHRPEEI